MLRERRKSSCNNNNTKIYDPRLSRESVFCNVPSVSVHPQTTQKYQFPHLCHKDLKRMKSMKVEKRTGELTPPSPQYYKAHKL